MGEFLAVDDARWSREVKRHTHDFYHLPEYARICAQWEGGEPEAYLFKQGDNAMLLPLLIRSLPKDLNELGLDASSPYGYPAALFNDGADDDFRRKAVGSYVEAGRARGLITTFIRLHPILTPSLPLAEDSAWTTEVEGPTVGLNLQENQGEWESRLSNNHIRDIRKLKGKGFEVNFDHPDGEEVFRKVYIESMKRIGVNDLYLFSENYFEALSETLGACQTICIVVSPDGEVAAGGLFVRTGDIVQYHLGGTREAFLRLAPSKLMFYETRKKMALLGARILHLGGGLGAQRDSLFRFKAGFAGREYLFATSRVVHDQKAYESLCQRRLSHKDNERFENSRFFPLYRQMY